MAYFRLSTNVQCFAVLCAVAVLPTSADLTAAVARKNHKHLSDSQFQPADAPLKGQFSVALQRMASLSNGQKDTSFYVGEVQIGSPQQTLQVLFDTSSGQVLLPHRACKSLACIEHNVYSPWQSATSMDVNHNGSEAQTGHRLARGEVSRDGVTIGFSQSDLGDGNVTSVFVRDHLCMKSGSDEQACVDLAVLAAINMDDVPFRAMPNDGIVGLGLPSLSTSPMSSFLDRLFEGSRGVKPMFGIGLSEDGGEVTFGGHNAKLLASPLQWLPVASPDAGYWQVAIRAVYVGDLLVDDCSGGCHGIVDTGASRLGVQADRFVPFRDTVASVLHNGAPNGCQGPMLTFDLGLTVLALEAKDYATADCSPHIGSLKLEEPEFRGVYVLGEALLRNYYAAFDWKNLQIAFAPLKHVQYQGGPRETSVVVI